MKRKPLTISKLADGRYVHQCHGGIDPSRAVRTVLMFALPGGPRPKDPVKEVISKVDELIAKAKWVYTLSALAQLVGYGMLVYYAGWLIATGVFFVHFGINLANSADKLVTVARNLKV